MWLPLCIRRHHYLALIAVLSDFTNRIIQTGSKVEMGLPLWKEEVRDGGDSVGLS